MAGDLKLVLFGAGRIGSVHFINSLTNQRASIKWIVEVDVKRAHDLVKSYKMENRVEVHEMKNAKELLSNPSIDGVMICTNHDTHAPIIKLALAAGKAVFCEKPLALEFEDIKECYDLAKGRNLPLMCAFNRRFDPDFALLKKRLETGTLGPIRSVYVICRDPKSLMDAKLYLPISGGIFKDSVVHQIDMANHLIAEQPLTVYATGHATHEEFKEYGDVDTTVVILKYPSGTIATLELSRWGKINHDQRIEVLGTEGMIQAESKRPLDIVETNNKGVYMEPIYEGLERYYDAYKQEVEHFIDVLLGKCKLSVTAESTLASFIIATACKVSLDKQQVIHLKQYAKDTFSYEF